MAIAAFSGSLRAGSFNTALLRAAQELAPPSLKITMNGIADLPLYNADHEQPLPPAVQVLKKAVKACDGLLIVSPEYDYSIPGGLKNALDWISRPFGDNSADDKPAAIMGASSGMIGTARGQYHMRQVLTYLNCHTLSRPEIMVPFAKEKFDERGVLTDEDTRKKVAAFLAAFAAWIGRIRKT